MQPNFDSMKQSQQAKRMNLAEWRASHIHELTLKSGLVITVRDCDMTDLMLAGKLPPSVLDMAEEVAKTDDKLDLQKIGMEIFRKSGPEFKQMLDVIAKAALIKPAIGEAADDDHILLDELTSADKQEIMDFINREVEHLKSFREGEDEPVAVIQHGDSLREEAEPVSEFADGDRSLGAR